MLLSEMVQDITDGTNMIVFIDSLLVFVLNHAIIAGLGHE
jgi:hypothetical protein